MTTSKAGTTNRRGARRTPDDLRRVCEQLSRDLARLRFGEPVTHVYDPLTYAAECNAQYLERYARRGVPALLLGMNPGPWGMVQTGVPFGEIELVRNWLKLEGRIEKPEREHPKRPVLGFDCKRSEVSGQRVWSWARARHGQPAAFFERFFVWNYCPLAFMEESGKNRTPDKLPREERDALYEVCDEALRAFVEALAPGRVIGIGRFAEQRARAALPSTVDVATILHPSPASPLANRGWSEQAELQLEELGLGLNAAR